MKLNEQQQHRLDMYERKLLGLPLECRNPGGAWVESTHGELYPELEYRIPVTKLNIPWDYLNSEFKYAAMDRNDKLYLYTEKPVLKCNCWMSDCGDQVNVSELFDIDTTNIIWETSLTERN